MIDYFLGRSGSGKQLPYGLGHLVYPLKFIASQLMTSSFAIIALFTARHFSPKQEIIISKSDRAFIFYTGVLPVLLMASISLLLGIKLKSMWGSPVMYMLGICIFVCNHIAKNWLKGFKIDDISFDEETNVYPGIEEV